MGGDIHFGVWYMGTGQYENTRQQEVRAEEKGEGGGEAPSNGQPPSLPQQGVIARVGQVVERYARFSDNRNASSDANDDGLESLVNTDSDNEQDGGGDGGSEDVDGRGSDDEDEEGTPRGAPERDEDEDSLFAADGSSAQQGGNSAGDEDGDASEEEEIQPSPSRQRRKARAILDDEEE